MSYNLLVSKWLKIFFVVLCIYFSSLLKVSAEIDNKSNLPDLINKVLVSDHRDRQEFEKQIIDIGKYSVTYLLDAYKRANYSERNIIGNLLIQIGADAVPALESVLLAKDEDLASNSAILLGEIGESSIPSLKKVLSDKKFSQNLERQRETAYALGRIGVSVK
jgi:hypothetical protein